MNSLRLIFVLLILNLVIVPAAQEVSSQSSANRFGVVEGFWFPDKTCELGVGWERIIFDWAQHQPDGPEDWYTLNVDDRWLQAADACDREVVALLKHTPAWATDGNPGIGVPRGLELPVNDPGNVWANFVRRTVDYYMSRGVSHFIIWNEPDITSDTYGYEFEGSLDDYYQMLRVAYIVAKETNPAATIHLAGTTYWHDVNEGREPYMQRLIEHIVNDPQAVAHDYYFDVLSLHVYFRTDSVYDIITEMRQMLDANGLTEKAIWVNEMNAAPTDDPQWPVERPVFQIDLVQQANFLVQAASLGLAAGAERMAVYKLYDQQLPAGGESFGILNPADATPRPAYAAWRMVSEYFDDVQGAYIQQTETLNAVQLLHSTGQETLVAWARTDQETMIEIGATADKAFQIDVFGNITVLRPNDGVYKKSLLPAVCEDEQGCFLGGRVMIVVQPQGTKTVRELAPDNLTITLNFQQE